MRPVARVNTILVAVVMSLAVLRIAAVAQSADSLSQVKTLYLDSFGPGRSGEILRRSLIRQLSRSVNYKVGNDRGAADAVLKGSGEIWIRSYITSNSKNPSLNRQAVYSGYLSVEIVGRNGRTLWSYLVTPSRMVWTNVADDLAANMVKTMRAASDNRSEAGPVNPSQRLAAIQLHGAGATFPVPVYLKWFETFRSLNPGVQFNYDAVGSETGIEMLQRGEIDFAGSDSYSGDVREVKLDPGYWHIPVVLGAVVPIYNLPGLIRDLRFTPEILAGIYLGEITKWNDPKIRRWNRSADLPNATIAVIHRSDGSGTTFTFSEYLSKVNSNWREKMGSAFQLNWPLGIAAEGNFGIAAAVAKTPFSIGYVELVYAIRQQLVFGAVRNSAGVFVRANLENVDEAAVQTARNSTIPASITNPSRKGAYPIATYTWLILPKQMNDSGRRDALLAFLQWVLTDGQKECSALAYTPLPREVANQQVEFVRTLMQRSRAEQSTRRR